MVRLLQAGLIAIKALITALRRWIFSPVLPSLRLHGKKRDDHQTDPAIRLAIDAVEKVFLRDFKWAFRRLPSFDTGIDARAEILDEGRPTGRFLPLQIRSVSPTSKRHGDHTYRGEKKHLDYWARHSLPVCVIIVDSESGLMLWQQVEKRLCVIMEAEWSIVIPATNVLDASARLCFDETITTDPELLMRSAFALDHALMQEMQGQTTFFVWDEWGDTTAIFGNLRIYVGEGQRQEPDVRIDYHLRGHSLHEVMTRLFPWATYSYAEPISEYSGEIAVHILEVELRPEAYAYLEAESFLEAGYPEEEEPSAPEPDDFITEEEEREFWRSRRTPHDPRN
jgi:hypothetical protein